MRRLAVWLSAAAAAIVVLAIAAAVALPFLVDIPRIQSLIAQNASQALGRPVRVTHVSVSALPRPAVVLRGLEIGEDPRFGPEPFLMLDRGELRLRLWPLVTGRVEFGDLILRKPLVRVVRDSAGRWNFASLGTPSTVARAPGSRPRSGGGGSGGAPGPGLLAPPRVRLDDGVVIYVAAGGGMRYRLQDLDLVVSPVPGAIGIEGAANVVPGDVKVKLGDVAVVVESGHTLNDAALRGHVTLAVRDLRHAVAPIAGAEPVVDGAATAKLVLGGTVGQPRAAGDIELPGVTISRTSPECPEPKRRRLALDRTTLQASWQNRELVGRPVATSLLGGTATTTLIVRHRGSEVVLDDVAVKGVALDKLLVDFLCDGYAVSGPLDLTGAFSMDPREPARTLTGPGQVRIGKGRLVGPRARRLLTGLAQAGAVASLLGKEPGTLESLMEFESIAGSFQVSRGVVSTRDLTYTSARAKVLVAGRYAIATGQMDLDVALDHGRGEIQAKVAGTAASPSVSVSPSSMIRSAAPTAVESGLRELLKKFR